MAKDLQQPRELIACAPPAPPQDIRAALAALSEDDLLRLRAIGRLRARSLPAGISWSDLLHEAVVRALAGTRPWPPGVDDPERVYAAAETLAAIHRLFASDAPATRVITGLQDGMTADEIRHRYGLSAVEYDTARRRIRRTLLRHGLTWSWP